VRAVNPVIDPTHRHYCAFVTIALMVLIISYKVGPVNGNAATVFCRNENPAILDSFRLATTQPASSFSSVRGQVLLLKTITTIRPVLLRA
jgi:hypothetical protein